AFLHVATPSPLPSRADLRTPRRVAVTFDEPPHGVGRGFKRSASRTLHLLLGTLLLGTLKKLGQALAAVVGDVEPIRCLGETQIRVNAGHHDPRINGQQLDADKRDPYIRI